MFAKSQEVCINNKKSAKDVFLHPWSKLTTTNPCVSTCKINFLKNAEKFAQNLHKLAKTFKNLQCLRKKIGNAYANYFRF